MRRVVCFLFRDWSAYHLAVQLQGISIGEAHASSTQEDGGRPLWKEFWRIKVPHKVRIFGWKFINKVLATRRNKFVRHLEQSGTCQICGMEEETEAHAMFRCPHAKGLRDAMSEHWKLPSKSQYVGLQLEGLLHVLSDLDVDQKAQLLLLWRTWYVRNQIVHNEGRPTIEGSVAFLRKLWTELCALAHETGFSSMNGKQEARDSLVCRQARLVQEAKITLEATV